MTTVASKSEFLALAKCSECPLAENGTGPVCGVGPRKARVAIVAEAPGRQEVQKGIPMIGPSGQLSDAALAEVGLKREDCLITNTTLCRPKPGPKGQDQPPPPKAVAACHERLMAELEAADPDVVIAMGGTSANTLVNANEKIGQLVGILHWNEELEKYVIPVWHTAYVLPRSEGGTRKPPNLRAFDDILSAYRRAELFSSGRAPLPERGRVESINWDYCTDQRSVRIALQEIRALADEDDEDAILQLALDLETEYPLDPKYQMLTAQISTSDKTWVLEAKPLLSENNRERFKRLLDRNDINWTLHNLAFDHQYLYHHFGVYPKYADDTMAMALCLTEEGESVSLKNQSRQWLNAPYYERELDRYGGFKKDKPTSRIPRSVLVPYGARDARLTNWLKPVLEEMVEEKGNRWLYDNILLPAQKAFADIEREGVVVDLAKMIEVKNDWEPKIQAAIKELQEFAASYGFKASEVVNKKGQRQKTKPKSDLFNPNSVDHKVHLLYHLMGYRKVGDFTTGKEFHGEFDGKYKDEPISIMLREYTSMAKLMSTYVYGFEDDIWPDGRIHPDIRIGGTRTGRLAIHDPPLQTLPRENTAAKNFESIRALFTVDEDEEFVEADYSILEMWSAYDYSGDENLYNDLTSFDFHTMSASKSLKVSIEEVIEDTKEDLGFKYRDRGKNVTYGVSYRQQGPGLSQKTGLPVDEATAMIDNWWNGYPVYHAQHLDWQEEAIENGVIRTPTGRERHWNLITPEIEDEIRNQAVNFPIQSLASDLTLMSLIKLHWMLKEFGWGRVLFTVHDSIEFAIKKIHLKEALKLIHDVMTVPQFPSRVEYYPIEIKVGPDWGHVKKVNLEELV